MSLSGWGSSTIGRQETVLDRLFEAPLARKLAPPEAPGRIEIFDPAKVATLRTDSPIPEAQPVQAF